MDANTMSQVGMSGGVVSILAVSFGIFKYINHRNIRSHCCGKQMDMGIDVDTPVPVAVPFIVPVEPV
jgi:hypothetical protein